MFRNNPGTTPDQVFHELETAVYIEASFKSPLRARKLTPSDLAEICSCHMEKPNAFWRLLLCSDQTKVKLFVVVASSLSGAVLLPLVLVHEKEDAKKYWNYLLYLQINIFDQQLGRQLNCGNSRMIPKTEQIDSEMDKLGQHKAYLMDFPKLQPSPVLKSRLNARTPANLKDHYQFC